MESKRLRVAHSLIAALFIIIFTVLPLLFSLLFNKSSIGLALVSIWYPMIPPLVLFLLGFLFHRKGDAPLNFLGIVWIHVGAWFLLQFVMTSLSDISIIFRILAMPSIYAGGAGVLFGTVVFLAGGIAMVSLQGKTFPGLRGGRAVSLLSLAGVVIIMLLGFPLFAAFSTRLQPGPLVEDDRVPSQEQIFSWISEVYSFGIRRPGSPADLRAISWIQEKLRGFGIEDVRSETVMFDYWEPRSWELSVFGPSGVLQKFRSFYTPYTGPAPAGGVTADMVFVGNGLAEDFEKHDVKRKIALVELEPTDINWDKMKVFSYLAYDPEENVSGWEHPYPIGWMLKFEKVYDRAEEHGAAGIVSVLKGYPDIGEFTYYAPYQGIIREIPCLYVMEDDGRRIREMAEKGSAKARIRLDATVSRQGGETANVYGVIPGNSESCIIFHTHHDAPWASGIEDSSGIGMVLALAKYYSQLPPGTMDRTLVFLFTGSHMVGARGNHDFMEKHRDGIMKNALMDICIEHISDDWDPPRESSGNPEPRGAFVSENPVVLGLYARLMERHNAQRTLIFPTGTPLGVPTDAGPFHEEGYRIHSLIAGPVWLFDDDDTLERVNEEELVPLTRKYIDLVGHLDLKGDLLLTFKLNILAIVFLLVLSPLSLLWYGGRKGDRANK